MPPQAKSSTKANTFESPEQYLASLPEDLRAALSAIRKTIKKNLPKGYAEGIQYGMLGYFVPHSVYPPGYHCDRTQPLPFVSVASHKNHVGLYLFCVYMSPTIQSWFVDAWKATGKKLDMGKSCVRVKKLDDVPLDVLGELIRKVPVKAFIESYEASLNAPRMTREQIKAMVAEREAKKKAAKKATKKTAKATTKKAIRKKTSRSG